MKRIRKRSVEFRDIFPWLIKPYKPASLFTESDLMQIPKKHQAVDKTKVAA